MRLLPATRALLPATAANAWSAGAWAHTHRDRAPTGPAVRRP